MSEPLLVSATETATSADKITCGICRRQFSKYTCPTCNLAYCSLTCFRSENHSQCSETFYRKEIESDIQSEPSKAAEERIKMMELLKRFEQESAEDEANIFAGEDGNEDEDDIAKRLASIDMESASPDVLWSLLTPAERDKFLKALDDPSSELAQQLLTSEELERERQAPWWEASVSDAEESHGRSVKRYGSKPAAIEVPVTMIQKLPLGSPLIYNICAVCIAYAYVTRHLCISPLSAPPSGNDVDQEEARSIMSRLVPFLTDRKSKTRFPNLSSVVTDVWSRFGSNVTAPFFAMVLRDAAALLRPLPVIEVTAEPRRRSRSVASVSLSSNPSLIFVLVLSDLHSLFERPGRAIIASDEAASLHQNHTTYKLMFYASQVLSTPSFVLRGLADELEARSKDLQAEDVSFPVSRYPTDDRTRPDQSTFSDSKVNGKSPGVRKANIEELP